MFSDELNERDGWLDIEVQSYGFGHLWNILSTVISDD